MYSSNDNYYGTLIPPAPYDVNGRTVMPPTPANGSEQTNHSQIPVDFNAALALASAPAPSNSNNLNGVGMNGNCTDVLDVGKVNFCPVPGSSLNDYPSSCFPSAQSNSPADYNTVFLSRDGVGDSNGSFYSGNSWTYQNTGPDCDLSYQFPPCDGLQTSPYNGQISDRIGMNASPYMMYPNSATDELTERFGCFNLNDALAAHRSYLYPPSHLQQSDSLVDTNWQSFFAKDRNGCGAVLNPTRLSTDTERFQAMNGDAARRAWALMESLKPALNATTNGNAGTNPLPLCNWGVTSKRSSQFTPNTDLAALELMGLGFRQSRHRPRVQKNGERPLPSAPRGIIRDGVYERLTDSTLTLKPGEDISKAAVGLTNGDSLQARLQRQVNPLNFNTSPPRARFFVIKSFSEDDIHRSIKYSIWCSTEAGNKKLNAAYSEATEGTNGVSTAEPMPIYLFFSVNGSGHFCGVAQMTSGVDYATRAGVWAQDKWQGQFSVKWIYVKDVPNVVLRHIHIETNDNKPVTHSRDTTEVPLEHGQQVLEIFAKYDHKTSILDDFDYYEKREQQELSRKETLRRR